MPCRVQQPLIINEVVEITPVVLEPAAPLGLPVEADGSSEEPPGKRQKRAESGGEEIPTEQLPGRMEAPQVRSDSHAGCVVGPTLAVCCLGQSRTWGPHLKVVALLYHDWGGGETAEPHIWELHLQLVASLWDCCS